ncbi:MAG: pyridoxal 5'-phosphate synthase glutaminase subunit PdxT [Cyanobacteria bacterium TGS_CYA1]|nr:pyridoxal 5'-phosphate synthase glutaminase subunit PdxT [Cyanobacteria bacterium TGS_CYA1]
MLIGVLALQGAFIEHRHAVERLGARSMEIRFKEQLELIDGLIIPGGESTCIDKLSREIANELYSEITRLGASGKLPIYGTCMGTIFLAKEIEGSNQSRLNLMDITVRRNAYGPQKSSFEADLDISALNMGEGEGNNSFPGIFLRAPSILSAKENVQVLCQFDGLAVMARQDNLLVTTFHPEITDDLRIHKYFIDQVCRNSKQSPMASITTFPYEVSLSKS